MPTKPLHFPKLNRRANYSPHKKYRDFRNEIQEDCLWRCVYCDAHEDETGGVKNMTLDHFRPKKLYPALEDLPTNLVWACIACNQLKGDDWPAHGTSDTVKGNDGYLDPFAVNRSDYFEIRDDGSLVPLHHPAPYMIGVLELNRSFLKLIRRKRIYFYKVMSELIKDYDLQIATVEGLLSTPTITDTYARELIQERDRLKKMLELIESLNQIFQLA